MEIPFCYGKIVKDKDYTDRVEDARRLYNNFLALTNTTIISPRRWGKSSLVNRALELLGQTRGEYLTVKLDAFNLKTSDDFLESYARSIGNAFTSHDELIEFLRASLPRVNADLVLGAGPAKLTLHMERQETKDSVPDILDLPQRLAEKKGKKVVVCIDEFQVVAEYQDSLAFQRMLRSCWQTHDKVAYCLFGSKFNLMNELVGKPKMPLYKFGDMFYLKKIATNDWIDYIIERFEDTGKEISVPAAAHLVGLVKNHSYYVQQLAQLAWFRTDRSCDETVVDEAFESLMNQLEMLFTQTMEELTPTQAEYLRAVCDGITKWNSVDTLKKYRMGTAANVKNLKAALEKREIITSMPGSIELQDPVFETWLRTIYFSD